MPTADAVRSWVRALRDRFPFYRDPDRARLAYLDSAAIPPRAEVAEEAIRQTTLDPRARYALQVEWLASVAAHLNVPAESLFPVMGTHGTVERIASLLDLRGPGRYLVTPDAHAAVMNALEILYAKGRAEIVPLRMDGHGRLDLGHLADQLSPRVRAVLLTHVSSVTGTRQEIHASAALIRDHRERSGAASILVVDGAQAVPRMPVDASGIDVYVLSSHKVGGMPGSVVAVSEAGLRAMAPEAKTREDAHAHAFAYLPAGTVHVEALGALAGALELLDGLPAVEEHAAPGMGSVAAAIGLLRDRAIGKLREVQGVEILCPPEEPDENAGILSFLLEGWIAADAGRALAERGVVVRAATRDERGHYYHVPLATRLLPALEARGGALRASFWITNTPEDVDRLAEALAALRG